MTNQIDPINTLTWPLTFKTESRHSYTIQEKCKLVIDGEGKIQKKILKRDHIERKSVQQRGNSIAEIRLVLAHYIEVYKREMVPSCRECKL